MTIPSVLKKERTMPVRKKQDTTSTNPTMTESTSSQNQIQHSFHQQLREHIRDATRIVMEEIMREELTEFLGAEWGGMHGRTKRLSQWKLHA
jgi:hypothetical protein